MRPNNEFTTAQQRFFYPTNREVEHHESFDTTNVPQAEYLPGQEHYAVLDKQGVTYAVELGLDHNMPVGVTIGGVKNKPRDSVLQNNPHLLRPHELDQLDDENSYMPSQDGDTQMIVQIDMTRFRQDLKDERFDRKGVAILPHGTALPSHAESGVDDSNVRYRLLGFINENDKLVTWSRFPAEGISLIDLCVANELSENRLEEALLHEALPFGGSLKGMAHTSDIVRAYLQYFDARHGTSFFPQQDPRFTHTPSRFGALTDEQKERYRMLASLSGF
jgi:hypothetical protein